VGLASPIGGWLGLCSQQEDRSFETCWMSSSFRVDKAAGKASILLKLGLTGSIVTGVCVQWLQSKSGCGSLGSKGGSRPLVFGWGQSSVFPSG
jgi:hypothetical protein